ncbi:MAG: N-acetyl-gamma-glutamyl-phosphate reductase [Fibrobacterota bacterium]
MRKRVFIDGQVGTTGLQIRERLSARSDIELVEISHEMRKDLGEKEKIINDVDCTILCLPDFAARESAQLVKNPHTRVIDASTAHRTDPAWAYGFPELSDTHRENIRTGQFIANPGCHATGFISLVYPLVTRGVVGADYPFTTTSITGYSGGGRKLIERYEDLSAHERSANTACPYALNMNHKHLPEMQYVPHLASAPVFYPIVGDFEKGMLVSVPLHLTGHGVSASPHMIHQVYADFYKDSDFVRVYGPETVQESLLDGKFLSPTACNNTNNLEIFISGHDTQAMVIARFDNLGKGASGAAVQNMNIALGFGETAGL